MPTLPQLKTAIEKRAALRADTEALRLFHGETEGDPRISIESFAGHLWVYEWETAQPRVNAQELVTALKQLTEVKSVSWNFRPRGGKAHDEAIAFDGSPPSSVIVRELSSQYDIRFQQVRHAGLFLDHLPLRRWLEKPPLKLGRVINTFSYTGSLSMAAMRGGAEFVTTLDLSRPTIEWAKKNAELNGFSAEKMDFIYGDYFDWIPRLKKKGERFQTFIVDPPSFSRGDKKTFSTKTDLPALFDTAIEVLDPRGAYLIASVNSEFLTPDQFLVPIREAAARAKRSMQVVQELAADPVQFPNSNHLKGWIVRLRS